MSRSDQFDRRQFLKTAVAASAATALPGTMVTRAFAADTIYLAVAAPMTGNDASMGLNAQRGADAAVAMINAAGGIGGKKVAYDIFDDQGSPKEAAAVSRRILDADKYFAVVGHVNSSCTLAGMPVYNEAGMPVLCGSSSNPKVTESGWDNIIRMTIRDDFGAQQYSAYAVNNLGKKKLAFSLPMTTMVADCATKWSRQPKPCRPTWRPRPGSRPMSTRIFSSVISSFKAKGVDAFMLNCNYTEGGLFLGQAKGVGITGVPAVGPDSLLYNDFITLSQGGAEGAYVLAAL